jgi:hypothetical protein
LVSERKGVPEPDDQPSGMTAQVSAYFKVQ